MNKSPTYYDLIEACRQTACPVCQLVQRGVQGYLKSLFYENVNDPETRLGLRETMGFCHDHAWLLLDAEIGDALGVSIIYHDVLGFTLKRLSQTDADFRTRWRFAKLLRRVFTRLAARRSRTAQIFFPVKHCPVCLERDTTTRLVIDALADSLTDEAMTQALAASSGLCLPHLSMTFERVRDIHAHDYLLAVTQDRLGDLRQELAEFIRRNDYRFHDEQIGAEGTAWRRVVGIVVGEKGQ
jgi:hypothetical protein